MSRRSELTGQTFGRLTVLRRNGVDKNNGSLWLCICACGKEHTVLGASLSRGIIKSCGCLRVDVVRARSTTHGQTSGKKVSPEYVSWAAMITRCGNPNQKDWHSYGGRGIIVCERWRESFENFLEDMGKKPKGLTLDRIDVNGNYEPGNCRWATSQEQTANKRKRTHCLKGHELTESNSVGERRRCLICKKERAGEYSRSRAIKREAAKCQTL